MDVDGAQLDLAAGSPHAVEQLAAAEDTAGAFHEKLQQPVFGRPELQRMAAADDAVRHRIEHDIADFDRLAGEGGADAPHHRRHPRHQLARGKRLGEIVVGAGVEAADAIILGLARGQHDDRDMRSRLVAAQAAAHLDPAGALDHPVEDDEIGRVLGRQHQRLVAVGRGADVVTLVTKTVIEQFQQRRIVLDEKQFRRAQIHTPVYIVCDRAVDMTAWLRFCVSVLRRTDSVPLRQNAPSRRHWWRDRRSARDCAPRKGAAPRW